MTTTLEPFSALADQAVAARHGADLYRFRVDSPIPSSAFAKNGDGSVTVTGVDLLKSGTFNGLTLLDTDLETMVTHFGNLRDAGIFLPPFRLDHSWSVLSVIGWHDNLETYRKVDPTDSLEKAFLRADLRITGSVDYTPGQIVDAIKRGALRNRSSELGYYVTNSGVELPLVFYGSAFVDIPAVEGLAPVSLSRTRLATPHHLTDLTDPERATMTDAQTPDQPAETPDVTPEGGNPDAVETDGDQVDEAGVPGETLETGAGVPAQPDADAETDGGNPDAAGDGTADPDDVARNEALLPDEDDEETGPAAELRAARAEIARLRAADSDRRIADLRGRGVIVAANEADAEFLLRHDDEDVRRRAGTLLANTPTRVDLGTRRGTTALSGATNPAADRTTSGITLGMPKDEAGDLWAALTSEERAKFKPEWDAYMSHRRENGIVD